MDKIEKLCKAIIGKSLYTYNSWNGSSMTINVNTFEILDDSVLFTGKNAWGGCSGIYVNKTDIEELVVKGEATQYDTIEYCDVKIKWRLTSNK